MAALRTPICDTLGIRHPIFGFSHEPDVVVAIAEAGGFPVLGLGRDAPGQIPAIVEAVERRLDGRPYGIDLMLPAKVPQQADPRGLKAALPPEHVAFVEGLRARFAVKPPGAPSFFITHARSEALFQAQIDAVLQSNARAVVTAIGLRASLIAQARSRGKLTMSLVGTVRHARKALDMGVDVLVAQGYDAGGPRGRSARCRCCRRSWMPRKASRCWLRAALPRAPRCWAASARARKGRGSERCGWRRAKTIPLPP